MQFSSMLYHIAELRLRIIKTLVIFSSTTAICYIFSSNILEFLSKKHNLQNLTSIKIFELFFTQLKISFFLGFLISFPYIIFQLWSFIYPGLHKNERKFFVKIIIASTILFFCGVCIGYEIIVPITYEFLLQTQLNFIQVLTSVENYMQFLISTSVSFGLGFQFPLIIIVLVKISVININALKKSRKIVFLCILIIACIITPPDILSPIILTSILYLAYELVLLYLVKNTSSKKH